MKVLILVLFLCACSHHKREIASVKSKTTYQKTLLFNDSVSLTQKLFPTYAKIHYDLYSANGSYLGKIELKRDKMLSISVLSPISLPYLKNNKNKWSGLSFPPGDIDYLQRAKFYTALQLGDHHQITLKALKENTVEMMLSFDHQKSFYLLKSPKAYPLD